MSLDDKVKSSDLRTAARMLAHCVTAGDSVAALHAIWEWRVRVLELTKDPVCYEKSHDESSYPGAALRGVRQEGGTVVLTLEQAKTMPCPFPPEPGYDDRPGACR